jgi:hypothetical protein
MPEQDLDRSTARPGLLARALAVLFPADSDEVGARRRGVLLLVAVTGVITALTAWRLLGEMDRGLDLSDEGTYLVHAQPASRAVGMSGFYGRYTSMLFSLVGQDVARFRAVGLILLAVAGAVCGAGLVAMVTAAHKDGVGRVPSVIAGLVGVNAALLYYFPRLMTPSYNWLVVGSVMWALGWLGYWWAGIVLQRPVLATVAATQVAAGAFIAFMAKLVAGPMLVVAACIVAVVLAWRERSSAVFVRRFAIPALLATTALTLFHFVFRTGPSDSLEIIRQLRDWYTVLDPVNYSVSGASRAIVDLAIEAPSTALRLTHTVALLPLAAPIVAYRPPQIGLRGAVYAAAIFGSLASLAFRGSWFGGAGAFNSLGEISLTFVVVLGAIAVSELIVLAIARVTDKNRAARRAGSVEIPLVVLASVVGIIAVPFGSGNGPLINLSFSLGLVLIAATVVLLAVTDSRWAVAGAFALIVAIGTPLILDGSRAVPYRQRPIAEQTVRVTVGTSASELYVDPDTAHYLTTLQQAAAAAGFVPGTPLLDFTQFSTTSVWALGGRAPDTVFLGHGTYGPSPAMDEMYRRGLERLDLEVFRPAWILAGSNNSPNPAMLSIIGLHFPDEYVKVAEVLWWNTGEVHSLWRPA